ncbi:MAG: OmpA family protein [Bacteroidales bacterium]|nr:OmpA family protein [Bacteroidales bacterium]
MKRITAIMIASLLASCYVANGQSLLERLGQRAKNAVENKLGEKVEQGVNDALDGKTGKNKKNDKADKQTADPVSQDAVALPDAKVPAQPKKQVETSYAKTDYVPGDEIFFEDTFENEQLGEFPLRWDLLDGYVETASLEGRKVLAFTDNGLGQVMPLMKDNKWNWLPEIFTLEFDLFVAPLDEDAGSELGMEVRFGNRGASDYYNASSYVWFRYREDGSSSLSWALLKPGTDVQTRGDKMLGLNPGLEDYNAKDNPLKAGEWNHFAFSFNKRAFKGYINGVRLINVPAMEAPGYFYFNSASQYAYSGISNVRLAKGAVPLYDRLMSEGKIVTYAITFETGKADLKPESMVEINRVAKLMKENPGLEFEVQGHCDATGSDKVNDPLSQKRAEAIVAALVEEGIAQARLTAVGKGSHQPIASNSTDEGRAKNRRVEFVKK